ncbi:MAG: alpha/beta hydrolase [Rhodospirillaceae bacterium]|jgi:triacylglycerol lipase|nr:alpha/beta hydrolase [Rhodospirillaceae bacterium]MBT3884044.1 alpha/beta hydrolase [Rhodospirillaceae bacterium]MBT4117301.1 alpha/beta hydrolase [Rhodospirillaceae bacterium]MBT4720349.1 alpha/beta hydrolase [Rhodospirillaceae bacterium]MBT4748785.1 alpha/beta hydrolase [Rhodospirillaceae bacterium]
MDQITPHGTTPVRGVQDNVAAKIREMGANFNPEILAATRDLYLPLLKALDWERVTITSDIQYGDDATRNLLDVHVADDKPSGPAPVVLFFHGGGFVEGHKNSEGPYVYGNVANYFAANGMIGVNCTYRLAPGAPWPAGAEDVGAAVAWARANIAEYGGDPDKIYVIGHSAGSAHVATFALHKDLQPDGGHGAAGVILMSGTYGINPERVNAAYYGDDASKYEAMQLLGNIEWGDFEVFVTAAEFEPIMFGASGTQLVAELTRQFGRLPRFKLLLGHNHPSPTMSMGTSDETVAAEILDFIQGPGA